MKSTNRRAALALLAGAVLLAALAIGAAVLFQLNSTDPAAQTNPPEAIGSFEPRKETSATDAGGAAQEKEPLEISPRLAKILQTLYDHRGSESNPKIREWLEWYGNKMIADGEEDDHIASFLVMYLLKMREIENPKELERFIEISRKDHLDETENDGWEYDPELSEKKNRIVKYIRENFGYHIPHYKVDGKTPRAVIEILVEGMDDLTAAKYLIDAVSGSLFPEVKGEYWSTREKEYAAEYADRVLAKDPTSRDALIVKIHSGVGVIESARLLAEHHPDDKRAALEAGGELYLNHPEEAIKAITRILPEGGLHPESVYHVYLGNAYERLDMMYEAADQFQKAYAAGDPAGSWRYHMLAEGERAFPSIWEERAAANPPEPASPSEAPETPQRQPDPPDPPDAPRPKGSPPTPPPGAEMDIAAAYADFAKAYQDAFKMEYGLSEATPEGYMNALLGMARAFARAGDAQHAQDAYNAVRKRHSREEVQQVFRRFDEQERLKRQASNEDSEEDEESANP